MYLMKFYFCGIYIGEVYSRVKKKLYIPRRRNSPVAVSNLREVPCYDKWALLYTHYSTFYTQEMSLSDFILNQNELLKFCLI
jgi:hypothetical protein